MATASIGKAKQAIERHLQKVQDKRFRENPWGARHVAAWQAPREAEPAIVGLYEALAAYADAHSARYDSPLGDDGVLGREWLDMAKGLRGLLNGELGRLDGGTLDALLYDMVEAAGFERSELEA